MPRAVESSVSIGTQQGCHGNGAGMVVLRCSGLGLTPSHGCQICHLNTAVFGVGGACASTAVTLAVNIEAAAGAGTGDAIDEPGVKHHYLVASLIAKSTACSPVKSLQRTTRCCCDLMKRFRRRERPQRKRPVKPFILSLVVSSWENSVQFA